LASYSLCPPFKFRPGDVGPSPDVFVVEFAVDDGRNRVVVAFNVGPFVGFALLIEFGERDFRDLNHPLFPGSLLQEHPDCVLIDPIFSRKLALANPFLCISRSDFASFI
jgi:hypothetical protein